MFCNVNKSKNYSFLGMLFFGYLNQTSHLCRCLLFDVAKILTVSINTNFHQLKVSLFTTFN